ncbi:uncharacterized protein LOC106012242 [Aplysia californica]|uniref:Uncharacterized protein LOC106012242 n=1 Tax=Aplysia californica TaxID=6500 RepID=A0ABM1VVW8_APLCA|nr:uncharacterized protein LOC106012242 [Aplysia californica]
MGNDISTAYPSESDVPCSVLQDELASLAQGEYCELEISSENEDLKTCRLPFAFRRCLKNPGHKDFVPIKELRQEHLPRGCSSVATLKWLKSWAHSVVRLSVRYVSKDRPKNFALPSSKGTKRLAHGTGVAFPQQSDAAHPSTTQEPRTLLKIVTAAHVVFDMDEVKHTTVEFFFDDDSDRSGVVRGKGVDLYYSLPEEDICVFFCELDKPGELPAVLEKLDQTYYAPDIFEDVSFCISHPHGCAKRVSFGGLNELKATHFEPKPPYGSGIVVDVCGTALFHFDEKKFFYYFILDVEMKRLVNLLPKLCGFTSKVLIDLETKGLVTSPSEEELKEMRDKLSENIGILTGEQSNLNSDFDQISDDEDSSCYKDGGKGEPDNDSHKEEEKEEEEEGEDDCECPEWAALSEEEKLKRVKELFPCELDDYDDEFLNAFSDRFHKLMSELGQILTEINRSESRASETGEQHAFAHSIPTCQGSSGAPIMSLSCVDGKHKMALAPHSRHPRLQPLAKSAFGFTWTW